MCKTNTKRELPLSPCFQGLAGVVLFLTVKDRILNCAQRHSYIIHMRVPHFKYYFYSVFSGQSLVLFRAKSRLFSVQNSLLFSPGSYSASSPSSVSLYFATLAPTIGSPTRLPSLSTKYVVGVPGAASWLFEPSQALRFR